MRTLPIAAPPSRYASARQLGPGRASLRVSGDIRRSGATRVVTDEPLYKTFYGKIHYLQVLERDHPLVMRPGQQYRLQISYEPDIIFAEE
jgi:hypothetical protein